MARKNRQQFYEQVELLRGGGEGHAIAKEDGQVIFVQYGAPGDVVDLKVIGRKKRFSMARIQHFHKRSEVRTEPFCAHYGVCGGCKWQHIDYRAQLELKDQWARDCMERIGKVEVEEFVPIQGASAQRHYRNKMEYTFSNRRWLYPDEDAEQLVHTNGLGFHVPGRFDKVVDVHACGLQDSRADDIRNFVRGYCLEHDYPFYDLRDHQGYVRNLMIRNTSLGQWMVCLFVAQDRPQLLNPLLDAIQARFQPDSLCYAVNSKRNDSIFDLDIRTYAGADHIEEDLVGLRFLIHPKSFFQTNTAQAEQLYGIALDMAGIGPKDVVYDLYCGTGTLTLAAAARAKHAIGVEIVEEAIVAARENASANALTNVHFEVGDMKDVFNQEFYVQHGAPDVIITDPPRAGMHPGVVRQLLEIACPRIVYVSCNPATQARDLEVLSQDYRIVRSQAVDMFPQTHHVENVVLLERRS